MKRVIAVSPDGVITFVHDEALAGLTRCGTATLRRASHVEPENLLKRSLFNILRRCFGDVGPVARWPRRWPGNWRVDLAPSGGPILGPFAGRSEAIQREVEWLNNYAWAAPTPPERRAVRCGMP